MADDREAGEGDGESAAVDEQRDDPRVDQAATASSYRCAFAQAAGIETALHNIVDLLTGNIAKLLAAIAMIVICIAWMFGYMDLRRGEFSIIGIRRHRTREHHRRG